MAELSKLPDAEQDRVAGWLLEELKDERRWDAQFARSQPQLKKLAQRARQQSASPLDPDKLPR